MSLDELRKRCGIDWPAIAKARQAAGERFARFRDILAKPGGEGPIDSEDISVVVFGSLARGEWTSGSDLDWTLLIDGQADHEHAHTARRLADLLKKDFKGPGPTGVFGTMAFSHNVIHQIGGEDDSNRNTTRRMLLLLESRPVHRQEAYDRVILGILRRYLKNDFRQFRLKVPRFLLNDLNRFWRTMCVDYANKYRERAGQGWAIRNVKLRMSRKLIFAAGLLTCFGCDLDLVAEAEPALARNPTVEGTVDYLYRFVRRTPLDIVTDGLVRFGTAETAGMLLTAYDDFLARMDDPAVREHLESLPAEGAEGDATLRAFSDLSRHLQRSLQRLFFDDNDRLGALTREYGVF
jgi:hypothetical protein